MAFQTYTDRLIRDDALKYKYKSDWQRSSPGPYNAARARGILETVSGHMVPKVKSKPQNKPLNFEN